MFSSKEVIKEVKLNQLDMLNLDKDEGPLQFSLTMISQVKRTIEHISSRIKFQN